LAQRSRKRGRREAPAERPPRRSTEERNAEIRAGLEPLAQGERPGAVTAGSIVAAVLGVLVLVGYFTDARFADRGSLAGALMISAVLFLAAWGMWNARYWAVLGFEALLAFLVLVASLALLVASNVWAVIQCVLVVGLGGWLFWKLIRVMGRLQAPQRVR